MKKITVYLVALSTIMTFQSFGQIVENKIYVNPNIGVNTNKGTKEKIILSCGKEKV